MRRFVAMGMLLVIGAWAGQASGTLTEVDLNTLGDGLLTFDSETSTEWLDLTLSVNRSRVDVASQLGPGGDFEGFQLATSAQIEELFVNAGIQVGVQTPDNLTPVADLMALLGTTGAVATASPFAEGFTGDDWSSGYPFIPFIRICSTGCTGGPDFGQAVVNTGGGFFSETTTNPEIGAWLVRAVPEPSTALLLGGGLVGLALRRRRSRAPSMEPPLTR